jgi:RNA polymerase sigma-70 factor (ECF subfamily)
MDTLTPVEALLGQLSGGDAEAARRVFLEYEPYLRMVVRRKLTPALRIRFDSLDIVQSIWADLLTGFQAGRWRFTNLEQLRAFLVKVTRNRLIDRVRQEETSLRLEQRVEGGDLGKLAPARPAPAGEQLEADEVWQRLLALCPPQHRGLLELKRQGLPLAEVAAHTGLHPSSVRRILYDLAARLAEGDSPPPRASGACNEATA